MIKKTKLKFNYFATLSFCLFGFIYAHLGLITIQTRSDGIYVGHINLYGDLLLHLAFINKFLQSGKFIVPDPIFAGTKPNYPPVADFLTAQIARFFGLEFSLFISTFLIGILGIYMARRLILKLVNNEKVVFISLLLFFINGGLGFIYFFRDFFSSAKPFSEFLFSLPREYTNMQNIGYWWINNYLAYFLPQRSFLFAFPITLLVFICLYCGHKTSRKAYFLSAGLLAGTLPLVQAHSLLLIFIVSAFYFPMSLISSNNKKIAFLNWTIFGLTTAILALPLFRLISDASNPLEFIKIEPGWTSKENIVWFWLKNLGFFAPVLISSIVWIFKKNKSLFYLYLPFLAVFFICNIFVFQPWNFDNSKLLIYWYFASCILVGYFLYSELFRSNLKKAFLGITIIVLTTLSGSIDIFRTFTSATYYQIFSTQDAKVGELVKNLTPKDAIFLTANNHNNPIVSLSGRTTLLGFEGWVWSHGLNYYPRKIDSQKIYEGQSEADSLIRQYQISYISVGPREKEGFKINEIYLLKFPVINLGNGWKLYEVSSLWKQ